MQQTESVWLGRLRGPVRLRPDAASAVALAIAAWLIVGQFAFGAEIGMYEMLRPEGRPMVQVMLWLLFAALHPRRRSTSRTPTARSNPNAPAPSTSCR